MLLALLTQRWMRSAPARARPWRGLAWLPVPFARTGAFADDRAQQTVRYWNGQPSAARRAGRPSLLF